MNLITILFIFIIFILNKCYLALITLGVSVSAFYFFKKMYGEEKRIYDRK